MYSSFLVMTCVLIRGYTMLLGKDLHRSLQVNRGYAQGSEIRFCSSSC